MKNIIIVGAGRLGRELACWLEHVVRDGENRIAGFLDDTREISGRLNDEYPYPVLGGIDGYRIVPDDLFVIAIGDPKSKVRIARNLESRGASFFSLIHPTAVVARTARLGKGVILSPYSLVSADAVLDDFVTLNTYASVGHDVSVGEGSTISSHVDLTGGVQLKSGVFVGSSASLLPKITVGAGATIGAGAVVVRSVGDGVTVYALPAKKL